MIANWVATGSEGKPLAAVRFDCIEAIERNGSTLAVALRNGNSFSAGFANAEKAIEVISSWVEWLNKQETQ